MNSLDFLRRRIIGQDKIIEEISFILNEMKDGKNFNILLRGPSGYGKNHIAEVSVRYLKEKYKYLIGDNIIEENFEGNTRIYILDEIHEMKDPEYIYPIMDSGQFILFLLTNEFDTLKEPLVNRCLVYNLMEYSEFEIAKIIKRRTKFPFWYCELISSYCRGNPRVAILTSKRLEIILKYNGHPYNRDELKNYIENFLNIKEGGFTQYDLLYLDFLNKIKRASLDTISYSIMLPKDTIRKEIEPFLLKKGLIRITSKGRILGG